MSSLNSPKSANEVNKSNISPDTSSREEGGKVNRGSQDMEDGKDLSDQQLSFQNDAYQSSIKIMRS
jgi:hypothetical protein